jgi:hypothetical protein
MMISSAIVFCALSLAVSPFAEDAAPSDSKARTLVIYDVRDLASDVSGTESPNGPSIEDLSALLRDTVLKDMSTEIQVQAASGSLVVVATPAEHRLLNAALTDLRTSATLAYEVDIRIVRARAGDVGDSAAARIVDGSIEDEVAKFMEKGDVLAAPRIVTRPLQRAMLSVLSRVKFVTGYEWIPEMDGFPGGLVVPEIGEFDSGVVVDVLVSPLPKEQSGLVRLELKAHVGEIDRPIRVEASEHGPVHKPVTTTREVKTTVTVPLGQVVRLASAPPPDAEGASSEDEAVVLLVLVRRLE